MHKIIGSIAIILTLLGCSTSNDRVPSGSAGSKPRHVIFFIHGVSGDHTTFIKMDRAIEVHLNQADTSTEYITHKLKYSTGNDTLDVVDFSRQISKQIDDYFKIKMGGLRPDDKISFITHSQGGIVGLVWLYNNYLLLNEKTSEPGFAPQDFQDLNPKYLKHFRNFVTLGTPFWGTKLAFIGKWLKESCLTSGVLEKTVCKITRGFQNLVGIKEVKGMDFDGPNMYSFRINTINSLESDFTDILENQIRFLNIAGVAVNANFLLDWFDSGRFAIETDTTVLVPSARYNFIYGRFLNDNYSENEITSTDQFKETNLNIPFILTNAVHAMLYKFDPKIIEKPEDKLSEDEKLQLQSSKRKIFHTRYSLAQAGPECISNINCDHKTLRTILGHFLSDTKVGELKINEKEILESEELIKKMSSFVINLSVLRDVKGKPFNKTIPKDKAHLDQDLRVEIDVSINENNNVSSIIKKRTSHKSPKHDNIEIPLDIVKFGGEKFWSRDRFTRGVSHDRKNVSVRNYYIGTAIDSYIPSEKKGGAGSFKDRVVRMKISAPGYRTRIIDVKVRPTFTTFVEAKLTPL